MMNESITRIFGYEKEELIDQRIEVLLPNEFKKSSLIFQKPLRIAVGSFIHFGINQPNVFG